MLAAYIDQAMEQAVYQIDVTVIIPNPHEGDVGVGLLRRLLRQAGVSREEWLGI